MSLLCCSIYHSILFDTRFVYLIMFTARRHPSWHAPLISTQRVKQGDLCEFEASLVDRECSRPVAYRASSRTGLHTKTLYQICIYVLWMFALSPWLYFNGIYCKIISDCKNMNRYTNITLRLYWTNTWKFFSNALGRRKIGQKH